MKDFAYALIPMLADAITPDPTMAQLIAGIRAPHEAMLSTELGRTEGMLYRRGTFAGTLDDLICDAVLAQRDAEIAFSPGFRWGPTLLPGQPITWEDIYNATAITYPAVYRIAMNGAAIKAILEGVADNLFYPDPYLQQGGDMVRVGGMGFTVHVDRALRRAHQQHAPDSSRGRRSRPTRTTWLPAGPRSTRIPKGPPIWDVVAAHVRGRAVVPPQAGQTVKFVRAGN